MSSCASCLILGPSEYHRRLAAPEGASSSSHLVRRASFSFSEILIGVFSSDRAASLTKDRSGRILNTELLRGGLEPNVPVCYCVIRVNIKPDQNQFASGLRALNRWSRAVDRRDSARNSYWASSGESRE